MRFKALIFFFGLLGTVSGQTNPDSLLVGVWKGTSLCQQKNSPCHDEQVVYHISKGDQANAFIIQANKIVQGKEEEMGALPGVFDQRKGELVCMPRPNSIWTFKLNGQKMDGVLYVNGALYRIVALTKSE